MRILFVMDEGIGNMVMATPALQAIKQAKPDAEVWVCGRRPALDVVDGAPFVDRVISETNETTFDLMLLSIWCTSFLQQHGREWLKAHSQRVIQARLVDANTHESEFHMALATSDAVGFDGQKPAPWVPIADAVPESYREDEGKPYIVLSDTTANIHWERKRWPYYPELAHRLIDGGYRVILAGGEREAQTVDLEAYPDEIETAFGLPLSALAALIREAACFVGNDSGPAHIAAATGCQTFVLFGATSQAKNTPLGPRVQVIHRPMPCAPCQYTDWWDTCQEYACMEGILPEQVRQLVLEATRGPVYRMAGDVTVGNMRVPPYEKLVAVMRIKDAMPTIRECLDSVSRVADAICIVDNGSTDGTLDVYEDYPKVVRVEHTEGLDEPRDRAVMDRMWREEQADWVLFIDSDEVLEPRISRELVQKWMSQDEYSSVWFRHVHFWGDKQHYRVDQRWKPRHRRGIFRGFPEATLKTQAHIHPNIVHDLKGRQLLTDYAVWHYGHIDMERNQARQRFYREVQDPADSPNWTGMTYDHMTDETYLKLAEWDESLPIDQRNWGNKSLLILMMHGLGDVLMLTPTVEALKRKHPDLEISVMGLGQTNERYFATAEVWANNPNIERYYESRLDHHPAYWDDDLFLEQSKPVIDEDVRKLSQLTSFDDLVLVTLQEDRHKHRIDRLAEQFSVELESRQMRLYPSAEGHQWAADFLKRITLTHGDKIASVHRFCGNPPKSWNHAETEALCHRLSEEGWRVLLWDQDMREVEYEPHQITGDGIVNMRDVKDELTILRTAALMEFCDVHIGADSLPMHIAAAAGIPVIGLFEKTRPHETAPMTDNSIIMATSQVLRGMQQAFRAEHRNRIVPVQGKEIPHEAVLGVVERLDGDSFADLGDLQRVEFPMNCIYDEDEFFQYQPQLAAMDDFIRAHPELVHNPLKWFDYVRLLEMLEHEDRPLRILDVGGGKAVFGLYLASLGHVVDAVDPDADANALRNRIAAKSGMGHRFRAEEEMAKPDKATYDIITCISVVEHVENEGSLLPQLVELLKPGGLLHVTCDFYERYIEYPDANRTLVPDRENHTDSRIYDVQSLYQRLIIPLAGCGMHLIGDTNFENVDVRDPSYRPVRGLYTFARLFFRKAD